MKVNFNQWQQVNLNETPTTPAMRYDKDAMPNFIATFKKIITIKYHEDIFERIIFENVINADTGEQVAAEMSVKPYAQLMYKLKGKEGKTVGVSYNGLQKHPKNPAKTLQTFAVFLAPEAPAQDETENLPF